MFKKLLVICGPTATGKTGLACNLARELGGEIISADSRQVYKWMDIGTGKDLGQCSKINVFYPKLGPCYSYKKIPIWGYDLVKPNQDFSVSQYFNIALNISQNIWSRGKLPVIVGGSGLYIKALVDGLATISIPPDKKLRNKLDKTDVNELFKQLKRLDVQKADKMNDSDRRNPRRLIRAIEVAYGESKKKYLKSKKTNKLNYNSLMMIGLTSSKQLIKQKIQKRVEKRIKDGFEKELQGLFKKGIDWKHRSMQSMGYRQYENYIKGVISWKGFIDSWILAEEKYAKRQMTWFKKERRINWFEISRRGWESRVEKLVKSWYYE